MKKDVIQRILKIIKNKPLRDKMIRKVNSGEDLTHHEAALLYGNVDFGEELPMTEKEIVDIDWTNHAEYRSELRDIDPHKMNIDIKDVMEEKAKKNDTQGKERFKVPSGTAVVDYNAEQNPADADVVTTWASTDEALQYLADYTGKRIIIANDLMSKIKSLLPKLAEVSQKEYDKWDEKNVDEYAGGGICHFIADEICDILNSKDIDCTPGSG